MGFKNQFKFITTAILFYLSTADIALANEDVGDGKLELNISCNEGVEPYHSSVFNEFPSIKPKYENYLRLRTACINKFENAQKICVLENNDFVQNLRKKLDPELTAIAVGVGSIAVACKSVGEVLRKAQLAVSSYQAACGAMKYMCDSSCNEAKMAGEKLYQDMEKDKDLLTTKSEPRITLREYLTNEEAFAYRAPSSVNHDGTKTSLKLNPLLWLTKDLESGFRRGVGCSVARCSSYSKQLQTAAVQAVAFMVSNEMASKCNKNVSTLNCEKAENAKLAECICLKNPRTTGCATVTNPTTGQQFGAMGSLSDTDVASGDPGGPFTGGDDPSPPPSSAVASGIGTPGSGGSTGVDGGGGLGAGPSKATGGGNGGGRVLSMEEAGGGGGGGFRGAGSSGRDNSLMDLLKSNSKYSNFLPGGKEDPTRLPASGLPSEISSKAGPSNWDKVRSQYMSNQYKMYNGQ